MKILVLNLESEYFYDILNGNKREEYREIKDYWTRRLENKNYDIIEFRKGYPKKTDKDRIIRYRYLGYFVKEIVHKKFNNIPTKVYAIRIGDKIV